MKSKITTLAAFIFGSAILSFGAHHESSAIEITANDTMQFSSKVFEVTAGKEVTFVLKNIGTLPKMAMGHNLIILKPGSEVPKFGMASIAAAATEYIPQDDASKALIVAHTKLLGPGEEDSITVTLEAGVYPFLCSFPGHFALMQGTITVK
jgi:azurin